MSTHDADVARVLQSMCWMQACKTVSCASNTKVAHRVQSPRRLRAPATNDPLGRFSSRPSAPHPHSLRTHSSISVRSRLSHHPDQGDVQCASAPSDVGCSGSDGGGAGLGRHHGLLYAPTTSHSNGFPPPNLAQAPLYPSGQSTPSAPQASRGLTACPSGSRGVRSRVPVEPADARSRPERGQGQAPRPA